MFMFVFAPLRHGLMGWRVYICIIIISMYCTIGGRQVCFILIVCTVKIMEQRTCGFFSHEGVVCIGLMWKS